ncbi:MAG: F0F1 ATP synthase subunit delta [Sphingomonas sanxanigenens]|uniref:ATP synthase subunit delta n=1 Tax=Sphingomonas sanxanigenens TaxID=397260 RepID=A0A2W5C2S6_9SPHN|nr:MAG: F0F1 ATP synthase subunit delta [Sphingomonas sanxanigenens]
MEISGGIQASLAGRYATALFDLARDANKIDAVEASLSTLKAAADESADLRELLTNPVLSRAASGHAIAGVAKLLKVDALTSNFLGVLAANRRLAQLGPVTRAFRALAAAYRGEVNAEVTSAHALAPAQVEALKKQLKARVGRDVTVDLSVDPAILGGLIVRIGSQMIDSSIRTRLNTLAHAMKG